MQISFIYVHKTKEIDKCIYIHTYIFLSNPINNNKKYKKKKKNKCLKHHTIIVIDIKIIGTFYNLPIYNS